MWWRCERGSRANVTVCCGHGGGFIDAHRCGFIDAHRWGFIDAHRCALIEAHRCVRYTVLG